MNGNGDEGDSLGRARTRLYDEFTKWQAILLSRYPALRDQVSCIDPDAPEEVPLPLPSFFNQHTRLSLGIDKLARAEATLRRGQAHDALVKLRMAIRTYTSHVDFKHDHVRGQRAITRAENLIQTLEQEKKRAAELYRRAYSALLRLGLALDDRSLQPLLDGQLFMKDTTKPAKLGDNRREDPWFWQVERLCSSGIEDQAWAVESRFLSALESVLMLTEILVDRVKWFRDRAARDRAQEEKEILEAEFGRTIRSFTKMSDVWSKLATKNASKHSNTAYAQKQAALYHALAEDCRKMYNKAIGLQVVVHESSSNVSPLLSPIIILSYDSRSRCLLSIRHPLVHTSIHGKLYR